MIRGTRIWEAWERDLIRRTPADFARNLRIAEAMLEHARAMGAIPRKDPLEGIEAKIRLARALNAELTSQAHRAGA